MNADKIESYIERVYGYAVNHTFSRDEADELSQEILFTVVRELPKLKDDNKDLQDEVDKYKRKYFDCLELNEELQNQMGVYSDVE